MRRKRKGEALQNSPSLGLIIDADSLSNLSAIYIMYLLENPSKSTWYYRTNYKLIWEHCLKNWVSCLHVLKNLFDKWKD